MRIFIVGAGKVGFSLAELLSDEEHDVYVIEKDQERADTVNNKLDVQVVVGNGASSILQDQVNIEGGDLMIAVTDSDEVNMLACMFAKQKGVKKTVARVRKVDYAQDTTLKDNPALEIDLFINPEQVTANAITNHIRIPEARSINFFEDKQVMMLELMVTELNPILGMQIKELRSKYPFLITAIQRQDQLIIPNGEEVIQKLDSIFIISKTNHMAEVEQNLGFRRKRVENVMILGGGRLGYYLAENLEPTDIRVKVIEKDYYRCEFLASQLESTIILNGDASDTDILQDEGIDDIDVVVGSTEDDKLNVLVCLLASRLGAKKTVAQIRRSDYLPLIETVGIDVAVSPRVLTSEAILRFVRKGRLQSVAIIETGSAEVIEFFMENPHSKIIDKPLMEIDFPKGIIIAALLRGDKVIIPKGQDVIRLGDRVTVFVTKGQMRKLERMIN